MSSSSELNTRALAEASTSSRWTDDPMRAITKERQTYPPNSPTDLAFGSVEQGRTILRRQLPLQSESPSKSRRRRWRGNRGPWSAIAASVCATAICGSNPSARSGARVLPIPCSISLATRSLPAAARIRIRFARGMERVCSISLTSRFQRPVDVRCFDEVG